MKKIILGVILGCMLTFSLTAYAEDITSQLVKIYDSATGGKIEFFDMSNETNVRIGSERGDGDNTGGALTLYNHSIDKPRVAAGISAENDAGLINLLDKDGNVRASIKAYDKNAGPTFFLTDSDESVKTYFTLTNGYINGNRVITEDYLEENYISKDEVQEMIDEAIEEALEK